VPRAKLKAATRRLRDDPECGKPLGGELRGCRSIRIEGENRLVYRARTRTEQVGKQKRKRTVVEVIAVSRRKDDDVYKRAERRVKP
jgi:hypothetical protein